MSRTSCLGHQHYISKSSFQVESSFENATRVLSRILTRNPNSKIQFKILTRILTRKSNSNNYNNNIEKINALKRLDSFLWTSTSSCSIKTRKRRTQPAIRHPWLRACSITHIAAEGESVASNILHGYPSFTRNHTRKGLLQDQAHVLQLLKAL